MARKSSNSAALEIIPLLAALLVLPLALAPGLAPKILSAITGIVFIVAGLGVVAVVALGLLRLLKIGRPQSGKFDCELKAARMSCPDMAEVSTEQPPPDLSEQLLRIDWYQFEKVVAWAYSQAGYQVSRRGGAKADGGIDLVIERAGQRLAVQCKQWQSWKAGVKVVREFLGAMKDQGFERGALVTLNACTGEAERFALRHGIQIVTKRKLLEMLNADSGHPELEELLDDRRKVCPKCESEMVARASSKDGSQFWGCSRFPRCRQTISLKSSLH